VSGEVAFLRNATFPDLCFHAIADAETVAAFAGIAFNLPIRAGRSFAGSPSFPFGDEPFCGPLSFYGVTRQSFYR
jgi:hypothetical protein